MLVQPYRYWRLLKAHQGPPPPELLNDSCPQLQFSLATIAAVHATVFDTRATQCQDPPTHARANEMTKKQPTDMLRAEEEEVGCGGGSINGSMNGSINGSVDGSVNAADALSALRLKVLRGCRLAFSGVSTFDYF